MSVHQFTVQNNKGQDVSLSEYQGQVLLIVNTATGCGLTPQYEGLEKLREQFHARNFEILDFPCNQFLEQAPGSDEEINTFCQVNYNTSFPRFKKIDVNGPNTAPLFAYLKQAAPDDIRGEGTAAFEQQVAPLSEFHAPGDIKWNFGKFLIGRDGAVVARYSPAYPPEALVADIEALLDK